MQRKLRESAASARSFIPRLVCFSEDRQRREVLEDGRGCTGIAPFHIGTAARSTVVGLHTLG